MNLVKNSSQLFRALFVALAGMYFKLCHAALVPTSALFADDYDALNRAIYYWSEGIKASFENYPFHQASAGLTYFYYISPWLNFPVEHRFFVVFTLNAILSSVTVVFASLAIANFRQKSSWLIPLVLVTFSSVYQFIYYVMTENMLFALLALSFWLIADLKKTLHSPLRLFCLALVCVLLPLTRQPGFAAIAGIIAALLLEARGSRSRRPLGVAIGVMLSALIPYLWYTSLFGVSRESQYVNSVQAVIAEPKNWLFTAKLALSQLGYIFFASGVWLLPFFLIAVFRWREFSDGVRERWVSVATFVSVSSVLFFALCLVHLTFKLLVHGRYSDPSPWFVYGRYNDPASLLILFGGLAAVFELPKLQGKKTYAFLLSVPFIFYGVRHCFELYEWVPINQAGLTIFFRKLYLLLPSWFAAAWLLLVVATAVLATRQKARVALIVFSLVVFNVLSVQHGMNYTIRRATKIEQSMIAAYWIAAHTPEDSLICYDFSVGTQRVPNGMKYMANKYKAMMFMTYPRGFKGVEQLGESEDCDYFYTLASALPENGFIPVWQNEFYVLAQSSSKEPSRGTQKS